MPAPHTSASTIPIATATTPVDRFAVCIARLLRIEGGFVNRPQDRGGPTNFGISLRFLTDHAADPLVHRVLGHNRPPSIDDVRRLDADGAVTLYRHFFWDANLCGAMPAPLDGAVFDQAVNGGGATLLQRTLNLFYHGALPETGKIGGKTLQLLTRAVADPVVGTARLLTSFRSVAENHYRDIVRHDKTQAIFLSGWVDRARSLGNV